MEHHLCIGATLGFPYVATSFGIIKMVLSYFVRRWDTHLGSLVEEDPVRNILKIHLKLDNVMTEINGRAAVADAISTSQVESVMTLGVAIVPREKR